jgi:hypothetical protein
MLRESFNAMNVVIRCNLYKRPLQNLLILRQRKSHASAAAAIEHRAAADYPEYSVRFRQQKNGMELAAQRLPSFSSCRRIMRGKNFISTIYSTMFCTMTATFLSQSGNEEVAAGRYRLRRERDDDGASRMRGKEIHHDKDRAVDRG